MFRLGHPLQCTSWYTQRSYARGTRERRLLGTERITELRVPGTCVRHDTEWAQGTSQSKCAAHSEVCTSWCRWQNNDSLFLRLVLLFLPGRLSRRPRLRYRRGRRGRCRRLREVRVDPFSFSLSWHVTRLTGRKCADGCRGVECERSGWGTK